MMTLMVGVDQHTFVSDWARAVARFSDVASLETVNILPARWKIDDSRADPRLYVRRLRPLRPQRLLSPVSNFLMAGLYARAIASFVRCCGPIDVVHTHFYSNADPIVRACRLLGLPVIHTEHSGRLTPRAREMGDGPSFHGRRTVRYVFSRAQAVCCVSEEVRREAERIGAFGRVLIVPNPVTADDIKLTEPAQSPAHIVTIGWLMPHKDHELILEAFAMAKDQRSDLQLTVIGDGVLRGQLQERARGLGIAEGVEFVGQLDRKDVYRHLSKATLYVHASKRESFGVALAEAWSCGLRVVAIAAGGLTDRATEFGGTTVRVRRAGDLAKAMLDELATPLGFEGRLRLAERARREFGVEAVASALRELYEELLDGPRRNWRTRLAKMDGRKAGAAL